jgi:FlaG/FlaF family flagellin (archaellin)
MIKKEGAVSPVIGVLLMLVVTIIIAAVVSAFAGGLTSGQSKAPQMTVEATYSMSDGMMIKHNGGDTLSVQDTKILVRPTNQFGNYEQLSWFINRSVIQNYADPSKTWGGSSKMTIFQPGQTLYISPANLSDVQTDNSGSNTSGTSSYYGFNKTVNLGKTFNLYLVDQGNKEFAQTAVSIDP